MVGCWGLQSAVARNMQQLHGDALCKGEITPLLPRNASNAPNAWHWPQGGLCKQRQWSGLAVSATANIAEVLAWVRKAPAPV